MSSSTMLRRRPSTRADAGAPTGTTPAPVPDPSPESSALAARDERPSPDAERVRALEAEVAQLRAAMASRASIEQAKGILMLLTSCGEQVAFDLLAHISSHTHRKVRDVAVEIVESAGGRHGLPPDIRAILKDACPPPHG